MIFSATCPQTAPNSSLRLALSEVSRRLTISCYQLRKQQPGQSCILLSSNAAALRHSRTLQRLLLNPLVSVVCCVTLVNPCSTAIQEHRPDDLELAEEVTESLQCYEDTNRKSPIIQRALESSSSYTVQMKTRIYGIYIWMFHSLPSYTSVCAFSATPQARALGFGNDVLPQWMPALSSLTYIIKGCIIMLIRTLSTA